MIQKNKIDLLTIIGFTLIVFIASLSLFEWYFDIKVLPGQSSHYFPMAPSTSFIFIIFSIIFSLIFFFQYNVYIQSIFLLLVGFSYLLASVILFGYLYNLNFKIEDILFHPNIKSKLLNSNPTGYMSLITSIIFTYLLSLLVLAEYFKKIVIFANLIFVFSFIGFLVSATLLLGYLYSSPFFYQTQLIPLAFYTTICFALSFILICKLSIKNTFAEYLFFSKTTHAKLLKTLIPTTLILIISRDYIENKYFPVSNSANALFFASYLIIFYFILTTVIFLSTKPISNSIDSLIKDKELLISATTREISERKLMEIQIKESLIEKEALLRELYHRTKNNMQVISAYLQLQTIHNNDEKLNNALLDIISRIQSMSLVHQKLYKSKNLSKISIKEYIEELVPLIMSYYKISKNRITAEFNIESIDLIIDIAIPLGLVLSELVSNSFKHAFPNENNGIIKIRLQRESFDSLNLEFSDNGIGLPSDFDLKNLRTIGFLTIIAIIEEQLQGSIQFENSEGLNFQIVFKDNIYRERV